MTTHRKTIAHGLLAVALAVGIASCGKTPAGSSPEAPQIEQVLGSSAVLLTAPPMIVCKGRFKSRTYTTGSHPDELVFSAPDSDQLLDFPGTHVLFAKPHTVGGVEYLVVGSIGTNGKFALARFSDANNDGVPDVSSWAPLFQLEPTFYLTDFTIHAGKWFFLDRRRQDIYVSSNLGDWPSGLKASPFARALDHPILKATRSIGAESATRVICRTESPYATSGVYDSREVPLTVIDNDGDDLAESSEGAFTNPVFHTQWWPYAGQTSLVATVLLPGTYEAWTITSAGSERSLLGSAIVAAGGHRAHITLSPALIEGEFLRVRLSSDAAGLDQKVKAATPQLKLVSDAAYPSVTTGASSVVQFQAVNLGAAGVRLKLQHPKPSRSKIELTYTRTSEGLVDVNIPALSSDWVGRATLWVTSSTSTNLLSTVSIQVKSP